MWNNPQIGWGDVVQILILAAAIYQTLKLFRGTRSAQILLGLAILLLGLIGITMLFRFDVLGWLLRTLLLYLAFALLVIFQPEVRRGLALLGRSRSVFETPAARATVVDRIVQAVERLARLHYGALIAIEREIRLRDYEETGTHLDAPLVAELLATIFYPHTPLHDGGVIVSGNRLAAARCVFPLSARDDLGPFGTRHRAAIGLSEETDAVIVVVSEETGSVGLAFQGRLYRSLTSRRLTRYLTALLPENRTAEAWRRALDIFGAEPDKETAGPEEGHIPHTSKEDGA